MFVFIVIIKISLSNVALIDQLLISTIFFTIDNPSPVEF